MFPGGSCGVLRCPVIFRPTGLCAYSYTLAATLNNVNINVQCKHMRKFRHKSGGLMA